MTNHWGDYVYTDVFMNIGGNTAESHIISMKHIEKAQRKGAKFIAVDPRFTHTAAIADIHVPIRSGTNLAFAGGMLNYIIQNERHQKEYVKHYTNATYLIHEDFALDERTGYFSGVQDDPIRKCKKYDQTTWNYQRDAEGNVLRDMDMQDPNCVWQIMKKIYSKYTIKNVSDVTGCPEDTLEKAYDLYSSTGEPGKAGNIMYALGITHFTHGSQNTRSLCVIQLLLGNMGIPGGGVNAQRGQSNVQGATDQAILYHIIPGYLGVPRAAKHPDFATYLDVETPKVKECWWSNKPKYMVSLLKEFWGDNATAANDFCYDYFPKLDHRDHSQIPIFKNIGEGEVKGLICFAENPVVGGSSTKTKRAYQSKLDWMVTVDIFETESAAWWYEDGVNPKEIPTEVFLLPAAACLEREGTKANSSRWIQWMYKAQNPPGEARWDLQIAYELFGRLQDAYISGGGAFPEPITKLHWNYGKDNDPSQVDIVKVCRALNGYYTDGRPYEKSFVTNFVGLQDDGSTACGNWLYSGYYNNLKAPACQGRVTEAPGEGLGTHRGWSFAWPLNRRIVYNRCSADLEGKPWNSATQMFWWDKDGNLIADKNKDTPDWPGGWNTNFEQLRDFPFIMLPEGRGRLFAAAGAIADGPLPIHYETAESLFPNLFYPDATYNPVSERFYEDHVVETDEERARYPYIINTYRCTEHYQTGIMTRNMPWLNEIAPELYIEMDPELASNLGIKPGDMVEIGSKRLYKDGKQGYIEARACVTERLQPFIVHGRKVHQVGMPFNWGYMGMNKGSIVNDLSPSVGCAIVSIPEYKGFLCCIRKKEV